MVFVFLLVILQKVALSFDAEKEVVQPKYVLPIEAQGPWESRRLWSPVAAELLKRPTVNWNKVDELKGVLGACQQTIVEPAIYAPLLTSHTLACCGSKRIPSTSPVRTRAPPALDHTLECCRTLPFFVSFNVCVYCELNAEDDQRKLACHAEEGEAPEWVPKLFRKERWTNPISGEEENRYVFKYFDESPYVEGEEERNWLQVSRDCVDPRDGGDEMGLGLHMKVPEAPATASGGGGGGADPETSAAGGDAAPGVYAKGGSTETIIVEVAQQIAADCKAIRDARKS